MCLRPRGNCRTAHAPGANHIIIRVPECRMSPCYTQLPLATGMEMLEMVFSGEMVNIMEMHNYHEPDQRSV